MISWTITHLINIFMCVCDLQSPYVPNLTPKAGTGEHSIPDRIFFGYSYQCGFAEGTWHPDDPCLERLLDHSDFHSQVRREDFHQSISFGQHRHSSLSDI